MKISKLIAFSLLLNAALLAALLFTKSPGTRQTFPITISQQTPQPKRVGAAILPESFQTNEVTAPFRWSEVESTDYPTYLTNLLAIDCPRERIRDILVADIDALFSARARDYVAPLQARFWELAAHPDEIKTLMESHGAALEKIEAERRNLFKALFNESNPHREQRSRTRSARNAKRESPLDFLDESKRKTIEELQAERNEARRQLRKMEFTGTDAEIRRQRETKELELNAGLEQKIRAVLTTEEFEEYRLRTAPAASIRFLLARMTVSEAEARRLTQILADKADAETALKKFDSNPAAIAELEERTQTQIRTLFGETRYREYQRASDYKYNQTAKLTDRLQLPETTAQAVYEARLAAEKLASRLRADTNTTEEERAAALAAVRTETENSLRSLVAPAAYADFKINSENWLNGLSQPANASPPARIR